MKVGDLVKYGKWFNGCNRSAGLILEVDLHSNPSDCWCYVMWEDLTQEWEELEVLERVLND